MMLGAVVWHWWIAPLLTIGGLAMLASLIVGYFRKVSAIKYPPKPKIPSLENPPLPPVPTKELQGQEQRELQQG